MELRDPHRAVGESGDNLQLAAHRLDESPQRAHVHVRPVLDLRDLWLRCTELLRELLLRKLPSTTQLVERHFGEELALSRLDSRMPSRRLARDQVPKLLCHSDQPLSFQTRQVSVVEPISDRDELFVPALIPCLVPSEEQDSGSPRIEGVENPVRPSLMLNPQLPHMAVPRRRDPRTGRISQLGSVILQKPDGCRDRFLVGVAEALPPTLAPVGVLD